MEKEYFYKIVMFTIIKIKIYQKTRSKWLIEQTRN